MNMHDQLIVACKAKLELIINTMLSTNQTFYMLLKLHTMQKTHSDMMNDSLAFFRTVIENAKQTLFIEINNMCDKGRNGSGIRKLLEKTLEPNNLSLLENNQPVLFYDVVSVDDLHIDRIIEDATVYCSFKEFLEDCKSKIESYGDTIKKVRIQRDKFYAHKDATANLADLFNDNRVSFDDINSLLVLNTNIAISMYKYFFDVVEAPFVDHYDDIYKLIKAAESWRKLGKEPST